MRAAQFSVVTLAITTMVACGGSSALKSARDESAASQTSSALATATSARVEEAPPAPVPPAPTPREITLPRGTVIEVRLDRTLSTALDRAGTAFDAVLDTPVALDGKNVIASGTKFTGRVTTSDASGRLKGRAQLGITLGSFVVDGHHYQIETSINRRSGAAHKARNVTFIGGGAGAGALIGGLTGGGKGAGIGAAVGAGAGTGALIP